MKIDGFNRVGPGGDPRKKAENASGVSFDSVLKESLEGKTGKAAAPASAPAPMPAGNFIKTANPFNSEALKAVERALGDLAMYKNALSIPDMPLNRLSPILRELGSKKERLVSLMPHVDDAGIKNLMAETAALLINENSRFHSAL